METTSTFGPASGLCATIDEDRAHLSEENGEKGNTDPEKLLRCPFDKNHLIRACRFPYHLIKCRKNHPKLAGKLKTCPFNACHLIPQHELAHHTEICADRVTVDPKESTDYFTTWEVPVTAWVNPDVTEDWDKEIEDNVTSFVWGANLMLTQTNEAKPSKHLELSFRAPNTLPWGSSNL